MKKTDSRQFILLAHGSGDARWCETFEKGLVTIKHHLDTPACLAYMEMASPSLETVIAKEYLQGIRVFDVLPLFFAEGRHLLHDVPKIIARLEQDYTDLRINLLPAVGKQNIFWEALGIMISTMETSAPDQTVPDNYNATDDDRQPAIDEQY